MRNLAYCGAPTSFRSGDKNPKKRGGPDLNANRVNRRSWLKKERAARSKNDLPTYKPFAFLNPSMLCGVESEEDSLPKGIGDLDFLVEAVLRE